MDAGCCALRNTHPRVIVLWLRGGDLGGGQSTGALLRSIRVGRVHCNCALFSRRGKALLGQWTAPLLMRIRSLLNSLDNGHRSNWHIINPEDAFSWVLCETLLIWIGHCCCLGFGFIIAQVSGGWLSRLVIWCCPLGHWKVALADEFVINSWLEHRPTIQLGQIPLFVQLTTIGRQWWLGTA